MLSICFPCFSPQIYPPWSLGTSWNGSIQHKPAWSNVCQGLFEELEVSKVTGIAQILKVIDLVVWLPFLAFSHRLGMTDELIFFRGLAPAHQPGHRLGRSLETPTFDLRGFPMKQKPIRHRGVVHPSHFDASNMRIYWNGEPACGQTKPLPSVVCRLFLDQISQDNPWITPAKVAVFF